MDWELFFKIITLLLGLGNLIGFTYKSWVEWKLYTDLDQDEDERQIKIRRAKLYFFGGIIGTILIFVFGIALCALIFSGTDDPPPPSPPLPTDTPITSENPASDPLRYFVKDLLYDGAVYTGYLNRETMQPDGEGEMAYNNGNVYDGSWVTGIQEGHGIMYYNNGDIYDGAWKDGKKNGSGVYTWNDGTMYNGEYKDDKRNGDGAYIGWTGFVETYGWAGNYYGSNEDDMFQGYGRFEFENGDKFVGIFSENKFWSGTYTRSDGAEFQIIDGEIAG